jgi:hypothetical protein
VIGADSARITPLPLPRTREAGVRRLFTVASAGLTSDALRWGERTGRWRRVRRSVYAEGPEDPTPLDRARARVLAADGVARGALAGVLHRLDAVALDDRPMRRRQRGCVVDIDGIPCADVLTTLVDLAVLLDDDRWEQALESALRRRLVTIDELVEVPRRTHGKPLIERVLGRRPPGAPPTESLLETLALQLARPVLGEPVRQRVVTWPDGTFVARVDLSWPALGVFFELDGQHHEGQPVYDARRETAVVAATGWLPGRFTWHEIVHVPRTTQRRFAQLRDRATERAAA